MKKRLLYIGNNLSHATFTATYISFFSEVLKKEGYSVKTASAKDNKVLRLLEMLYLIWKNRNGTDMVLIDTYGAHNFYYAYSVGKLCQHFKLPYIPILHGGNLPGRLKSSKKLCRDLFENAFLNVAPSHFLYDIFKLEGFQNIKIIPNAIILSDFPFKERKEFRPNLLWVRRFQEHYNPMMALLVYERLLKEYPDAKLCMVGPEKDGSMEKCKDYATRNKLPVIFTGKLKKAAWARLSVDYDFFINTTRVDNTPISVIEVMALGLPVISTHVGGMPFLIDDGINGILVPENSPERMLAALFELLKKQEKCKEIAMAANQKVRAYHWDTVKAQWMEVLGG